MANTKVAKKTSPTKAERASSTVQRLEELVVKVCATSELTELKELHNQIAKLDIFRAVSPATIERLNRVEGQLSSHILALSPSSASAAAEVERIRNTVTSS